MISVSPVAPLAKIAPSAPPAPPSAMGAAAPTPGTTPVRQLPTWYGTKIGRQDRGFFSHTGDVNLYAGQTFPTRFRTVNAAMQHAVTRTIAQGAVAVMQHQDRYFITRLYNAEYAGNGRYEMRQTDFSRGFGKLKDLHPSLRAIVDAAGATFTA